MHRVVIEFSYVDCVLVSVNMGFLVEVIRFGLSGVFTTHGFVVLCVTFRRSLLPSYTGRAYVRLKPEDVGRKFFRNIDNYLPINTVSRSGRFESSACPLAPPAAYD